MTSLSVSHLTVNFGSRTVISDLSFELRQGEIASLLGPSGCGKTTLLRAIAGLIQPASGAIRFGSQLVGVSSVVLPPHKRGTGYVPQQGALFPHLSVAKNIAFGLDKNKHTKSEITDITREMIGLIGMKGMEERLPSQLSGGESQRVAIARAIINDPEIILADEPTGSLDLNTAKEIFKILKNLKKSNRLIIFATHNRFFANKADCLLGMTNGSVKTINV